MLPYLMLALAVCAILALSQLVLDIRGLRSGRFAGVSGAAGDVTTENRRTISQSDDWDDILYNDSQDDVDRLEQPASPATLITLSDSDKEAPPSSDGPRILIVDDNATNRMVMQALCGMFGCNSQLAEDGLQALGKVCEGEFDLILMDIKMPRLDGVQATQAIRALSGPVSQIPIIAVTANADPEDARRYLSVGMSAVVHKPIKPEHLLMAMNAALAGERQEEAAAELTRKARA